MATKPSALIDTRVIYCGDNLDQLRKFPAACVDLSYIDPPFNSNRNYEVFWGETKERRSFEDRHESTKAYIDYMRPRCIELHRVLKKTGSFIITAIGTLATTSKSCSTRFSARTNFRMRSSGKEHTPTETLAVGLVSLMIQFSFIRGTATTLGIKSISYLQAITSRTL